MHEPTPAELAADERIVARLMAADPPAPDWLQQTGVTAVRDGAGWKIIATGDAPMARFYGHIGAAARRSTASLTQ